MSWAKLLLAAGLFVSLSALGQEDAEQENRAPARQEVTRSSNQLQRVQAPLLPTSPLPDSSPEAPQDPEEDPTDPLTWQFITGCVTSIVMTRNTDIPSPNVGAHFYVGDQVFGIWINGIVVGSYFTGNLTYEQLDLMRPVFEQLREAAKERYRVTVTYRGDPPSVSAIATLYNTTCS